MPHRFKTFLATYQQAFNHEVCLNINLLSFEVKVLRMGCTACGLRIHDLSVFNLMIKILGTKINYYSVLSHVPSIKLSFFQFSCMLTIIVVVVVADDLHFFIEPLPITATSSYSLNKRKIQFFHRLLFSSILYSLNFRRVMPVQNIIIIYAGA